jgi:hypothetical protein
VKASGLNRRPSTPCRLNTGRNDTVMTSKEKKSDGPTSCIAETITAGRLPGRPSSSQCSSRLWTFSTRMTAASTMAPIATAMPPSDMMLAVSPCPSIGMNDRSTATGSVTMGTSALRAWSRNRKMTRLTTIISSISVRRSVPIESRISPERS